MTQEKDGWFTSLQTLQQLYSGVDVQKMEQFLLQNAKECSLLINSYAFKNLTTHLLILLIRIDIDAPLDHPLADPAKIDQLLEISCQKENILRFVDRVEEYCQNITGKPVPESDHQQIVILSVLSCMLFEINPDSVDAFAGFMEGGFFNKAIQIILKMDSRYDLEYMSNIFLCQFVLHLYNLYWRASIGLSYPNPLSRQRIHELHYAFGEELHVLKMCPYLKASEEDKKEAGLIITTSAIPDSHPHIVHVNPILTRRDLRAIREEVEAISEQNLRLSVISFLLTLFQEKLYFRNRNAGQNYEEVIRFLCRHAENLGFIGPEFVDDVLNRETLSSTAFTDQCAIPHGITAQTSTSFIAVLHNDIPISWNGSYVNFVLLRGIREQDMHQFRAVFDVVVNSFSDIERTLRLLKTDSWEEFIRTLVFRS